MAIRDLDCLMREGVADPVLTGEAATVDVAIRIGESFEADCVDGGRCESTRGCESECEAGCDGDHVEFLFDKSKLMAVRS